MVKLRRECNLQCMCACICEAICCTHTKCVAACYSLCIEKDMHVCFLELHLLLSLASGALLSERQQTQYRNR